MFSHQWNTRYTLDYNFFLSFTILVNQSSLNDRLFSPSIEFNLSVFFLFFLYHRLSIKLNYFLSYIALNSILHERTKMLH